jgi:hypothetical protein
MPLASAVDNFTAALGSGYTAGSGSVALAAGSGAILAAKLTAAGFPAISASAPLRVTLITAASYRTAAETLTILKVTGLSGDTLTGATAIEGTTDRDYAAADVAECRWTAGGVQEIQAAIGTAGAVASVAGRTGTVVLAEADVANLTADLGTLTTAVGARLVAASNLSDVANAGTARTNLGLGDTATLPLSQLDLRYAPASASGSPYVLQFPQATPCHVNHGLFWPRGGTAALGTGFFWDAWMKPIASLGGYLVSAGYGGSHELLWGFAPKATGNLWNGAASTSFAGTYTVADGEWIHAAILWDGANVYTFINGVCDGMTAWAGPRMPVGANNGLGNLYVMGSDHSNAFGALAALRGWDGALPVYGAATRTNAFIPERVFNGFDQNGLACDFLSDYTTPGGGPIPDRSPWGYPSNPGSSQRYWHHGERHAANNLTATGPGVGGGTFVFGTVMPTYAPDATCPYGQAHGSPLPAEAIPAPATVPSGAKIFDSFGRRNQTFAFQAAPTLGSTEGGSLGPLPWTTFSGAGTLGWGILQGSGVQLRTSPAGMYVPNNSADMDVRVSRDSPTLVGSGGATGLAFRVQDSANYWALARQNGLAFTSLTLYSVVAGAVTQVGAYTPAFANWTILRAVTSGTTITVYTDNGSGGWNTMATLTGQTALQSATGAGLATDAWASNAYTSSLARYRNFTVF